MNQMAAAQQWQTAKSLYDTSRFEAALPPALRAVELAPDFPEARLLLGGVLNALGRPGEALPHVERAVQLRPRWVDAHLGLATTCLYLGDFARGYAENEWRFELAGHAYPPLPGPRWRGQIEAGRTLLLFHAEGYGDVIQCVGYVPMLAQRGMRILLTTPAEMAALLATLPGVTRLLPPGSGIEHFDYHQALHSLPACLPQAPAEMKRQAPYLFADAQRVERFRQRLASCGPARLRVGVVWSGNPKYFADAARSMPVEMLKPLANVPGMQLHSLQKGAAREQIRRAQFPIVDHADALQDFADTAALTAALDLVISVDTSVAHLAGALAKPVWMLLPQPPSPRWMMFGATTPWYPTARIFRQPRAGDWQSVIAQVTAELSCHHLG